MTTNNIMHRFRNASPALKRWMPYWRQITNANGAVVHEGFAMEEADIVKRAIEKGVSLRGADLSGIDFTGRNLRGVNFTGTVLESARFGTMATLPPRGRFRKMLQKTPIIGEPLDVADLEGARFRGAGLHRANLRGVTATGCDFSESDLRGADMAGADFRGSIFDGADMTGVMVDQDTKFSAQSLRHASNIDRILVVDRRGEVLPGARIAADGTISTLGGITPPRKKRNWVPRIGG